MNGMNPTVSVIVPVYNAEKYLRECMDSLMRQTMRNIEIIAIDDGSSDHSPEVLDALALKDDRLVVVHQENAGASCARNAGLELARGKYVLFVDADDFIRFDTCECLVERARGENADVIVFGGKTFPTSAWADASFASRDCAYSGQEMLGAIFVEQGGLPLMCNKLYSKELLDRLNARLPVRLTLGEDHAFQLCVLPHANRIAYCKEKLYFYRNHEGSVLSAGDEVRNARVFKHLEVVRFVVEKWKADGLLVEHEAMLLHWLTNFLFSDLPLVTYNKRVEASAVLAEIVRNNFSDGDLAKMDNVTFGQLDQMLSCANSFDEEPLITFIVINASDGSLVPRNMQSILNQSEQRIRCLIDSSCAEGSISSYIESDKRCRSVSIGPLADLLAGIESPYVVFAPTNCYYHLRMVEHVLNEVDFVNYSRVGVVAESVQQRRENRGCGAGLCDVVIIRDSLGRIESVDPYKYVRPKPDEIFNAEGLIAFSDFDGNGYSVLSFTAANKIINTAFLKGHCPHNGVAPYGAAIQAILALQFSNAILIRPMPFASFADFPNENLGKPWAIAEELNALLEYGDGLDGKYAKGYRQALAEYCVAVDRAAQLGGCNEAITAAMRYVLDELTKAGISNCGNGFAELRDSFSDGCADEHTRDVLAAELASAYEEVELRQAEIDNLTLRIEESRLQVDEVYSSISYRVGRGVTLPARKVFYGMKGILSRGRRK